MAHHQLDELDEKILKLIIGNARMPFLEVARECNVSGAASKRYRSAVADTGSRGMPLYNGAIRPVYKNIRKEQPAFAKHHPQQASTIGLGSHRIAHIL